MTDRDLIAAYRRTEYEIRRTPSVPIQIGGRAPSILSSTAILTAYNPASEIRPADANARADRRLNEALASWRVPQIRAVARDPAGGGEWTEPGYAVRGLPRAVVVELAETFGQNAIVWIGSDAIARLVVSRRGFAGLPVGATVQDDAATISDFLPVPQRPA